MEHRADRAFIDEACDTSAITKAALAAQDMGNARQALDLLRVGAELAEQHGEAPVTDAHVETARERVQRGRIAKALRDQTEHAQYILEAIAILQTSGEVPARSTEIQRTSERMAESHAASPLSTLKRIQDHLSDRHMLGFLRRHEQNKGLRGGSTTSMSWISIRRSSWRRGIQHEQEHRSGTIETTGSVEILNN